jgi:hypothetical protein
MQCLSLREAILKAGITPANAVCTDSVSGVVVGCTPGHVNLVSFHRPVVLYALGSSCSFQFLDAELRTDSDDDASNKDV